MATKKQSNAVTYNVKIYNDTGLVKRKDCEVVSIENGIVNLRYKKPRSSKFAFRPIPASSVVLIDVSKEKGTTVMYKGRELVAEYRNAMIETTKTGMLKISVEGRTIEAAPAYVEAEATDETGAAAPKKSGGKKGGKKKE